MSVETQEAAPLPLGPRPVAVTISANDVAALHACGTRPDAYMQLILAALRDAGAPVEGTLRLRLAHGRLAKVKDDVMKPQDGFVYVWLPDEYVAAIASGAGGQA